MIPTRLRAAGLPALLLFALGLAPSAAQTTLRTLPGSAAEAFAASVAFAGDADGDGVSDLALGASQANQGGQLRGRVDVVSGRTGALLHTFEGHADFDQLGSQLAGAGDVNADGYDDLIVGTLAGNYARVYSGVDGAVLHTFSSGVATDFLGSSVGGAGDVDADGYDDLIVGTNVFLSLAPGYARVHSGADGSVLHTFSGDDNFDRFGFAVSGAGDVDADGYADLVVGARGDDDNGSDSGSARVLSGVDGSVLFTVYGDTADDFFGQSVAGAGDVDGDGYDDVIVGAPGCGAFCFAYKGYARVFAGPDGSELHTVQGLASFDEFGLAVAGAGDVDGDGRADFAVGARGGDDRQRTDNGRVDLYSGATGERVFSIRGDGDDDRLGSSVALCGDANGDGVADLLAGSEAGYARVVSIPLGRSTDALSAASGGTQVLSVVAGPEHAGRVFALLGSPLGSSPPLAIGSVLLPLDLGGLDASLVQEAIYLSLRLQQKSLLKALVSGSAAPGLPLTAVAGRLDGSGERTLSLKLPAGASADLIGLSAFHAYAVFDESREAVFASNAASLTITP